MDRLLTIILAGGPGERLQPLTKMRSKPAVPFAGKFRLIDFTLSNCINSGIRHIYILIQYRSWSLQRHIQEGWGISSSGLGEYIYCVPAQQKVGTQWYRGTADAIRQNLDLVRGKGFEHVLILSGDHVYKMNYLQMLDYHKMQNADLTISAIRVRRKQAANNLGVLLVGKESEILGFEEKPAQPKAIPDAPEYALASMGIYMFKTDAMMEALQAEGDDFGKDIVPNMIARSRNICAYDFGKMNKIEDYVVEVEDGKRRRVLVDRTRDSSYWRDVGSIDSYYQASMELVGIDPLFNLYGERWVFRTYERPLPPTKCIIGGKILDSLVSGGCIISGGLVQRSLLSPGVVVERGAVVEDAVVFDDVVIEPDVKIRRAIIDKEARIHAGASIGYDPESDKRRGCAISDNGIVVVPRGIDVGPI